MRINEIVYFVECMCYIFGIVNGFNVCELGVSGYCICKKNVEGKYCMYCKDIYYDLYKDNVYGCIGD